VKCQVCKEKPEKDVKKITDIPIAFEVETMLKAMHTLKHSQEKEAGTEYCDDHGIENLFLCESPSCFMEKNEALEKSVDKCHVKIDAEKKEFSESKSKLKSYITLLKKEEEAHSVLKEILSELTSKHEEKRTYLESERLKVEKGLADQDVNINIMNSLKSTVTVTSIKEATELTDAAENITKITKNKRLAEEKRCGDFRKLDASIEARKSTRLEIKKIKSMTDTDEVKLLLNELKTNSAMVQDLSKHKFKRYTNKAQEVIRQVLKDLPTIVCITLFCMATVILFNVPEKGMPQQLREFNTSKHDIQRELTDLKKKLLGGSLVSLKLVTIVLWIVNIIMSGYKYGMDGLRGCYDCVRECLSLMAVDYGLTLMVWVVSEFLGKGGVYNVLYFTELIAVRCCALLPIMSISQIAGGGYYKGNYGLEMLINMCMLGTIQWLCREELNTLELIDAGTLKFTAVCLGTALVTFAVRT